MEMRPSSSTLRVSGSFSASLRPSYEKSRSILFFLLSFRFILCNHASSRLCSAVPLNPRGQVQCRALQLWRVNSSFYEIYRAAIAFRMISPQKQCMRLRMYEVQ